MAAGPDSRALARGFTLAGAREAFVDDPYPTYAALREQSPVHRIAADSWLLTRYDDVLAAYRESPAGSGQDRSRDD